MPPMTGRVIAGRYNLQHPIGRGAMGVVWRARDQILDRDVAVKEVVISSLIGEEERRNAYKRTLREARTAARLSHRGLVAVYDVAEEDGRPWIVMELVPSRSLDQVLTVEGRLAPLRVARIGQQLLSALAAAHLAGVLHRDVKPSNVLIATDRTGTGWDERAVLTDFGIAQFEGDPRLTQTGMVMGSPGFTAPERIRGGDATPASDLWSLGATLYAAVEGRGPYEQRGGAITTMSAIINEDAPVAAHAGRLAPVIEALLRRDPSSRPAAPAAARMFAYVLPLLSAAEPESPAPAHPPTAASPARPSASAIAPAPARPPGRVPASGSSGTAKPEPARELAAAAAPAAIAAPAPAAGGAVAATTAEDGASAIARPSARRSAEGRAPTAPAAAPSAAAPSTVGAGICGGIAVGGGGSGTGVGRRASAPNPVTEPGNRAEPGGSGARGEDAGGGRAGGRRRGGGRRRHGSGRTGGERRRRRGGDAGATARRGRRRRRGHGRSGYGPGGRGRSGRRGRRKPAWTQRPTATLTRLADVAAEPADEAVSAVDAVSAVEAPQTPDDIEDAGAPVAADAAVGAAERAETGAAKARRGRLRDRPEADPIPAAAEAEAGPDVHRRQARGAASRADVLGRAAGSARHRPADAAGGSRGRAALGRAIGRAALLAGPQSVGLARRAVVRRQRSPREGPRSTALIRVPGRRRPALAVSTRDRPSSTPTWLRSIRRRRSAAPGSAAGDHGGGSSW